MQQKLCRDFSETVSRRKQCFLSAVTILRSTCRDSMSMEAFRMDQKYVSTELLNATGAAK